MAVDAFGAGEDERRATLWLQAQRLGTGQFPKLVGPGTGGIDQHRGAEGATAGLHLPEAVGIAAQLLHFAVAVHFTLLTANTTQVALVQGVGVDVTGARVVQGAMNLVAAQHWQARAGLLGAEQLDFRHAGLGVLVLALQLFRVAVEVDGHFPARAEQRVLGEARRRMVEKLTAGQGQRADLRCAIGCCVQRGRAAGGVVTRLRLALKQQHPPVAGQPVTCGGTGNTGADDDEISVLHGGFLSRRVAGGTGRWPGRCLPGPGRWSGRRHGAGSPVFSRYH
ncbi:hypothetical protein D3C79_684210 [compost metagenome]